MADESNEMDSILLRKEYRNGSIVAVAVKQTIRNSSNTKAYRNKLFEFYYLNYFPSLSQIHLYKNYSDFAKNNDELP